MALQGITWFWNRFRPREGWLALFLLAAAAACLVTAVTTVQWVPESSIIIPATFWGLALGTLLAKRPLRPLAAWSFLTVYGFLFTTVWLGNLSPPLRLWVGDWPSFSQHIQQHTALFFDRTGSWFIAAFNGGRSQETIVFAFGLGLAAWFLAAFAAWSAYRQRRPLPGLTTMGAALALNGYYGGAPLQWTTFFIAIAALLTAVLHFANQEQTWAANHVDYSDQIRLDLIMYAGGMAITLWVFSLALPGFSITKLARTFQQQPAVLQAEETLDRLFGGVKPPRGPDQPAGLDRPGGRGILPRAYLLGNPPELSETVVMTAVVTLPDTVQPALLDGRHWRALSYDVYTGRGWALSEERQESIPANTRIPLPLARAQVEIQQTVSWVYDERIIRYTLGLPLRFNQDMIVIWRGRNDLVRAQGDGQTYQVASRLAAATPNQLRAAHETAVPPAILARYAALPNSVPDRVYDLAQDIAGTLPTAYDQARALEQFLRQYPYSLDVELPPEDVDPVDFFLFDLQRGYCDYYASAMAVMARSLGLPARMAVGFLPQPLDENGVQTIFQINGHSWTEIYFPDYGWVEFEPTAAFPSPHDRSNAAADSASPDETQEPAFPDMPEIPPAAPSESLLVRLWRGWNWILLAAALGLSWWLWQRRQQRLAGRDVVVWAYGRLQHNAQKLGQTPRASQTPDEFTAAFLAHLNRYAKHNPRLTSLVAGIRPHIERLNRLFVRRRYRGETASCLADGMAAAQNSWQQVRRPLWLLRLINKLPQRQKK